MNKQHNTIDQAVLATMADLAARNLELQQEKERLEKAVSYAKGESSVSQQLNGELLEKLLFTQREVGRLRSERDSAKEALWAAQQSKPHPWKAWWGNNFPMVVFWVVVAILLGWLLFRVLFPCAKVDWSLGFLHKSAVVNDEGGFFYLENQGPIFFDFSWGGDNCQVVPEEAPPALGETPESTPQPAAQATEEVETPQNVPATLEPTAEPTDDLNPPNPEGPVWNWPIWVEEAANDESEVTDEPEMPAVDDGVHGEQLYRFIEVDLPDEGGIDYVGQSSDRPKVERRDLAKDCWIRDLSANSHVVIQRLSLDGGSYLDWGGPFPVSETGKLCIKRGPGGVYWFEPDPIGPNYQDPTYDRIVKKSRKLQVNLCFNGWTVCSNDLAMELARQGIPAPNFEWRTQGVQGLEKVVAQSDDNQILFRPHPAQVYTLHGCMGSSCSQMATLEYGDIWKNNVWFHGLILEEPDLGQITIAGDAGDNWDRYQIVQRTTWKGFDARRVLESYRGKAIEKTDFDVPMFYLDQEYRPVIVAGHILDRRTPDEKARLYDSLPIIN